FSDLGRSGSLMTDDDSAFNGAIGALSAPEFIGSGPCDEGGASSGCGADGTGSARPEVATSPIDSGPWGTGKAFGGCETGLWPTSV
ncbi:MAG: hypothetical protein AAB658_19815, partial [Chloroflexota bacterium]